ncbi:MAG: hypothetical protein HN348_33110, partial [Proteobacteria bacterium]|nr:hypothetical protein [Pseudomonadota bacterium]
EAPVGDVASDPGIPAANTWPPEEAIVVVEPDLDDGEVPLAIVGERTDERELTEDPDALETELIVSQEGTHVFDLGAAAAPEVDVPLETPEAVEQAVESARADLDSRSTMADELVDDSGRDLLDHLLEDFGDDVVDEIVGTSSDELDSELDDDDADGETTMVFLLDAQVSLDDTDGDDEGDPPIKDLAADGDDLGIQLVEADFFDGPEPGTTPGADVEPGGEPAVVPGEIEAELDPELGAAAQVVADMDEAEQTLGPATRHPIQRIATWLVISMIFLMIVYLVSAVM